MTISELLTFAHYKLNSAKIPNANQEAIDLLSHTIKRSKEYILTHGSQRLKTWQIKIFKAVIRKRAHGRPFAYCVGWVPFLNTSIQVGPGVLIPRPETEELIELILPSIKNPFFLIADVGTGSGAIALTLAKNFPNTQITATDKSEKALIWARKNKKILKIKNVLFFKTKFLNGIKTKFDIIIANLPYLPFSTYNKNKQALKYEPRSALVSSLNGTKDIRKFITKANKNLKPDGQLWLEIHDTTADTIVKYAKKIFENNSVTLLKDLSGRNRFIRIKNNPII